MIGAPLYLSGSVHLYNIKLLNLEGFRESYLIFAMEGKIGTMVTFSNPPRKMWTITGSWI